MQQSAGCDLLLFSLMYNSCKNNLHKRIHSYQNSVLNCFGIFPPPPPPPPPSISSIDTVEPLGEENPVSEDKLTSLREAPMLTSKLPLTSASQLTLLLRLTSTSVSSRMTTPSLSSMELERDRVDPPKVFVETSPSSLEASCQRTTKRECV